jgi:phosphoglycolate phosphatase
MVGDSATDVAAARAAGVPVVVVAYGYSPVPAHALGGDAVIERFSDLPAALTRLFGGMPP